MAFVASISNYFETNNLGLFAVLQHLRSVGWVVTAAGDGLSAYSANPATAGTLLTSGRSGANGFGNTRAWFAIQSPDGLNAFTFQTDSTTGGSVRLKWSPGGVFSTGGTFNTTPPVTGGVQGIVRGGGSDASPSYSLLSSAIPARFITVASDTAPYIFWFATTRYGVGNVTLGVYLETVTATLDGDTSPYVIGFTQGTSGEAFVAGGFTGGLSVGGTTSSAGGVMYWVPSASPSELIGGAATSFGGGEQDFGRTLAVNGIRPDPFTSKEVFTPMAYLSRYNIPGGQSPRRMWKGIGETLYWCGIRRGSWDLYTLNTPKDRILLGDVLLPWDGSNVVL